MPIFDSTNYYFYKYVLNFLRAMDFSNFPKVASADWQSVPAFFFYLMEYFIVVNKLLFQNKLIAFWCVCQNAWYCLILTLSDAVFCWNSPYSGAAFYVETWALSTRGQTVSSSFPTGALRFWAEKGFTISYLIILIRDEKQVIVGKVLLWYYKINHCSIVLNETIPAEILFCFLLIFFLCSKSRKLMQMR